MSIYFDLQNNPVLITPNVLSVPKITAIAYPGDDTAADTAGGQTITITGTGFLSGASVIINGSQVGVVSVVNSTTITFTSPAQSAGSYVLYVVNTDGGTAVAVPGIQYSGTPVWSTAAGSLGSYTETQAIANTVTATGDAPITYSLYSGSLPTGATLNTSNGYISGTSPLEASPTTFTFTIRATDGQQQDTNRTFSLTINPDVVTWSSPANGTTYTNTANSAISNVTLSASAASGQTVTYSANALPTGLSLSGSNISGTPTVVANSSTLLTATAATTNVSATRTINWVISVAIDTYFPYVSLLLSANTPSSTFVADSSTNGLAITISGDTRPNNFNPYTPGYYSNYFDGTGDYLNTSGANLVIGTNSFTVECWVYPTADNTYDGYISTAGDGADVGFSMSIDQCWLGSSVVSLTYAWKSYIKLNLWNHLAITRDNSGVVRWFVNGALLNTSSANSTNLVSTTLVVGRRYYNYNGYYATGYISNVRCIIGSALYTATFTPSTTPFTAVSGTQLLTCQSSRYIDNSTNNFTITKNGDTTVSGFIPYTPNSSYSTYGSGYFDGTGDWLTVASSSNLSSSSNWSIEAWVYPTALALNNDYNIAYGPVNIYTESSQCYIVYWSSSGGTSQVGIGSLSQTLNNWMHIAFVNTASTGMKVYFNGTQIISRGAETITMGTTYIGANSSGGQRWTGYISGVRVINGGAIPIYTTNFTPPTTPLTAVTNTQLLTLQSNQPNTNNMFVDNSTNNYLITRNGNPTQGAFSPYAGSYSNYFDGTGDYLQIADNVNLRPGTGDFTYEFWWYPTSVTGIQEVIVKGSGVQIYSNGTGIYLALSASNSGSYYINNTFGTLSINTWHHIAVVRSGNTYYGFLNGTTTTLATSSSSPDTGTDVMLIGAYAGAQYPTSGYISNVRFVKGTAVYTSAFTPPTAPLTPVTNTQLLTCQSNRLIDNSINNFTITKGGDTSVQKFSPFTMQTATVPTSYSGYFDGTGDYLTTPVFGAGAGSGLFTTGATFTVEAWLYQTSYVSASGYVNTIIGDLTPTAATALWWAIGTDSTNAPVFRWYDGSVKTCTGTVALSTSIWNHVAFVCNSGILSIYVNGTSQSVTGTTTISTPAGNQSSLVIGADRGYYVTGYISNLRVVNTVAVYTGNFTTPTSPLAATQSSGTNISAITGTQTALLTLQSTTFIDNSTNLYAITAYGDSKPTIQNPFGYTNPAAAAYSSLTQGGSMYFDGTGDYLSISSTTLTLFQTTFNWSIEAWVYPLALPANVYTQIVSSSQFSFGQYDGGEIRLTNNNTGWGTGIYFTLNQWQHVAFVNKASTYLKLYVNGVERNSTSATGFTWNTGTGTKIGSNFDGSQVWNGYVTDVRIIFNAANPTYTANFLPPTSPLAALQNTTLLTNGTSAGIYDSSMNNDFETVGDAKISTSLVKFAGKTSMYFDGTGDGLYNASSLTAVFGTGDLTIEFWMYNNVSKNASIIDTRYPSDTANAGFMISIASNDYLRWGTFGTNYIVGGTAIANSVWYYVAATRSGNTFTLFVNGTSDGTYTGSATQNFTNTGLYIGTGRVGDFNGYLSDVRITKGYARYTSNFTPPTSPFKQF